MASGLFLNSFASTVKILNNWAFIQNSTFTIKGDGHLLEATLLLCGLLI